MKEKTVYVCDICGEEFETKVGCEAHGDTHLTPKDYIPNYSRFCETPGSITVTFDNARTQTYYKET